MKHCTGTLFYENVPAKRNKFQNKYRTIPLSRIMSNENKKSQNT